MISLHFHLEFCSATLFRCKITWLTLRDLLDAQQKHLFLVEEIQLAFVTCLVWIQEKRATNLLLKVDPHSTFRKNFLQLATNIFVAPQADHAMRKTKNIDPRLAKKQCFATSWGFLYLACFKWPWNRSEPGQPYLLLQWKETRAYLLHDHNWGSEFTSNSVIPFRSMILLSQGPPHMVNIQLHELKCTEQETIAHCRNVKALGRVSYID